VPILLLSSSLFAEEASVAQYNSLVGSYACIGRWPDSNKTFSGRVEISKANEGVKMIRLIDREKIEAVGKYRTPTPDNIPILKVKFNQKGKAYEETGLINSD